MNNLGRLIMSAVFLTALVVASAHAQMGGGKGKGGAMVMGPPGGGMGMWDGEHGRHIITMLDLDDNQTAQVKSILYKLQKDLIKKRAEIEVAEVELEEILTKDPVDMHAVEPKVRQIAVLKAEAAMMHIQGIEALKTKLTPEQKKKLTETTPMKRMGWGMLNCPMMKGKMPEGHHSEPVDAPRLKGKAGKTSTPQ